MAKAKKSDSASAGQAPQGRSLLAAAYAAFERGDMVTARRLANEVIAGKAGKGEEQASKELSQKLSSELKKVEDSPLAVAQDLVSRTNVVPKSYWFAALSAGIFVLLVVLAAVRY